MNIQRMLDLKQALQKKSIFLLGPRQTGKSWLIRHTFKEPRIYNLLQSDTFLNLNHAPQRMRMDYVIGDPSLVMKLILFCRKKLQLK